MKKTILALGACAFILGACGEADKPMDEAMTSPYANESGIDMAGFNDSVDPAQDFFEYVNGTWVAETEIPGDATSYGTFRMLRDESEANQRTIIEELAARDDLAAGSVEQKIGDFYASLLNQDLVEGKGAEPLTPYFEKIDSINSKSDLVKAFGANGYTGVNAPLAIGVFPDLGDSTRYMSYIFQNGLSLPSREHYLSDGEEFEKVRAAYPGYIASLFEMAGFDNGAERAENVIAIETKLAEKHWSPEENRNIPKIYNLFDTANLKEITDQIDWTAFLDGAGLAGSEEIVAAQLSYFEALGDIINETSLDAWKDYLRYQTLNQASQFMSSEFENANFEFMGKLVNGLEAKPEDWKTGVRVINASLGEGVGKVYVDRYFPPEAKAAMEDLVGNLMLAFKDGIQNLDWMSDETKAKAEEKRSKMMTKIGYPDEWETYDAMEIRSDDPIGNLARATAWAYQDQLDKLGGPIDRGEWGMTPQTVNAYHNPTMNEIVFPAAILQPPFFNAEADPAVNYGAIGAVIGHEIGHAFDDNGRRFDGDGNLADWWTEEDAAAFEERAEALAAQYDQYSPLEGLNVNGHLTLGENIGDLTGITLAYKAYHKSLNGEEAPVINGLTGDQRFFIGFAQVWRNKYREESLRNQVLTNPHSPSMYRANGPVSNFQPFYDAFGVEEGDALWRPENERVKIW